MLCVHLIAFEPKLSLQEKPVISFVHVIEDGRLPSLGSETEPETPAASPSALDIETISLPTALTSEVETVSPELTL